MLSGDVEINYLSVQPIITEDFGMMRVSVKVVPKEISTDQKDIRVSIEQSSDCVESNEKYLKIHYRHLSKYSSIILGVSVV